jgi:hypothetical protein
VLVIELEPLTNLAESSVFRLKILYQKVKPKLDQNTIHLAYFGHFCRSLDLINQFDNLVSNKIELC